MNLSSSGPGRLLSTTDSFAPLFLRLSLAVVMFPHGAQKVFGWFGGYGFTGTMDHFTGTLGVSSAVAFLVIAGEFLGSLGLAAGMLTRFAAAGLIPIMIGAIKMVHLPNGFFMNWYGNQEGEGFEYHLLVLGMALALVVSGGGRWSMDRKLTRSS